MSIDLAERHRTSEGPITTGFVDCDIHISLPSIKALFLICPNSGAPISKHLAPRMRHGLVKGVTYAKSAPNASRRDAWPPNGGPPGSDLAFMREQYLDRYDVRCAMMNPLHMGEGYPNLDLGAAVCRAVNEWQIADWVSKDSRLRASHRAPLRGRAGRGGGNHRTSAEPGFAQALLLARTSEPLGRRRYWPIYEAAEERGLPIAIHVGGYGGHPVTSSGWPSYYIEDQNGVAQACLTTIASLVFEGVFERFPKLKFLVIEGGFAWLPSLSWRLDKHWRRLRSEVPHLKRRPPNTSGSRFG